MNQKIIEEKWLMWLTLFLAPPMGIFLLWRYKHYDNKVSRLLSFFAFAWLLFVVIPSDSFQKNTSAYIQPSPTIEATTKATESLTTPTSYFTPSQEPSPTLTPTPTIIPTPTVSLQEVLDKQIETFKNSCEVLTYKELARNPSGNTGKKVKLTGRVMQTIESSMALMVNITKGEYGLYSDNIFVSYIPLNSNRVLEKDIIVMWGTCDGLQSYKTVLGAEKSIPKINVKYYEILKDE